MQEEHKQELRDHLLQKSVSDSRSHPAGGKRCVGADDVKEYKAAPPGHLQEEGGSGRRESRLNKYALGAVILASTNSILLGYGKYLN